MKEIDNLPKGQRVSIYGAGEAGRIINNYIIENRPDLTVYSFFDEKVSGQVDGLNIYHIKDIQLYKDSFDVVIVASFSNSNLMQTILNYYGINNFVKVQNITRWECACAKIEEPRFEKVKKILSSDKSREIYELIVNSYFNSSKSQQLFSYLQKEIDNSFHPWQYLNFINRDCIKTVISGGASDGLVTIHFLEAFLKLEKIYAFEPLYQEFKKAEYDLILKNSNKVEIIEKGLLDKNTTANIVVNGTSSKIHSYLSSEITREIETISVDDFVEVNNIEKVDFIKMDIEGAELKALKGAEKTIVNHRPQLAICIYHSYEDLFEIPLYLSNILKNYRFEVYHYSLQSNGESVFYAIPEEVNGK